MRRTPLAVALVVLAAVAAGVGPAAAKQSTAATFAKPLALPKYDGGEPSLALDGNGGVYVVAPQGLAGGNPGIAFWGSHDHGRTFPIAQLVGSSTGGGDSDVSVGKDGTVYVADLELTANAICRSSDRGKTFVDAASGKACNDGAVLAQHGYVSDREWIDAPRSGNLYLTYHDVHIEFPYTLMSTDQGRTFVPCGPTSFSATGQEWQNFTPGPTSGTQVPKPVFGPEGQIYTMFATGNPTGDGGFDHLWLTSTPSCTPASVFTTSSVYAHAGASLAQPFDGLGIDGGGTLYVIAGGHLGTGDTKDNVWLFRSENHGKTWSKPFRVNAPGLKANMLPTIVGGARKGQVAVGWFGSSTASTRADGDNVWKYYIATSFDGGRHFTQKAVSGVMHEGAQARALLDFTTIMVEPKTGAIYAVFAGDADGKRKAYLVRQTGGRYFR